MDVYDTTTLTIMRISKSDTSHYAYDCSITVDTYLLSKTICRLSFRVFSVVIKYGQMWP